MRPSKLVIGALASILVLVESCSYRGGLNSRLQDGDVSSPEDTLSVGDTSADRPASSSGDASATFLDAGGSGDSQVGPAANGSRCASDGQCASQYCAEGVCCETACTGQCESCGEPAKEGQCV